ncbi:HlyD family efflux transporter periplasmic adaptor subunit [Hydrogenoanaerobacterium sp.]|uniref:HlyD family efflux transporter periplasmic adaptor subunit n=1 Tax=Hydrogenoanaerobacterium sp. TaxID=2953763 RepID=UPI00289B0C5B|nr:HlyD family efflux transporter periplasmic adaptor subunit [Hydrogenoanaerobacterium sp.]
METLSGKILTVLMSLFLLLYVGYQGYRYYYSPIKTETVLSYTVQDTKRIKGLIVRDENIIDQSTPGVVAYYNDDGVKVTYGTPVAEVYANKEDVINKRLIKDLDEELKKRQSIQNPGNNYYLNSEAISKQINENLYAIIESNESHKLADISVQKSELITNLNKKQLATGVVSDFSNKINELQSEKSNLENSVSSRSEIITATQVGYFSSYVDGMEQVLTLDTLESITVEQLQGYLGQKFEQDNAKIGKVISQRPWYFVVAVPKDEAVNIYEGVKLNIDFGISSFGDVPATVTSIRADEGEDEVIVVMSCDYMSPQLTRMRNPSAELNFQVYTGLKIPDQAVRFVDNRRGVYVNTGSEIRFKTIDVIYEGTGYVLSNIDVLNKEQVQLFDDIVVEGTDMTDGKPVN